MHADAGGGVYATTGCLDYVVEVVGGTVSGNTATGRGGGIAAVGVTVDLDGTLVDSNGCVQGVWWTGYPVLSAGSLLCFRVFCDARLCETNPRLRPPTRAHEGAGLFTQCQSTPCVTGFATCDGVGVTGSGNVNGNVATGNGGGVYATGAVDVTVTSITNNRYVLFARLFLIFFDFFLP